MVTVITHTHTMVKRRRSRSKVKSRSTSRSKRAKSRSSRKRSRKGRGSGCKSLKGEGACGGNPNCAWANNSCRGKPKTVTGNVVYEGPMGPPPS